MYNRYGSRIGCWILPVNEFTPLDVFVWAAKRWWLVVLFTVLGGCLGWAYHWLQPSVYEAQAVIVAQIDFTQTGDLTELEQDQVITAVMGLFVSSSVLEKTLQEANTQQIPIQELTYGKNVSLERRRSWINMLLRDSDPLVASEVGNLWAETSYAALAESYEHALQAQVLREYLATLNTCLQSSSAGQATPNICGAGTLEEIEQQAQAVEDELYQEVLASNGIIPGLVFDLSQRAQVPESPVAYRTSLLIMAGALIGFVLGVLIANMQVKARR